MSRWLWTLRNISSHLWPRALIFGIIAIVTALASIYLKDFIPTELSYKIGAGAVEDILKILASSMLAVTIFSVSTMVGAYSSATNNVTPRATKLLLEDKLSHNALSTFIGSFIFSIVGIIALKAGAYGESGQFILYLVTIILVAIIIVTMFTWIDYLSKLGRVHETIGKVETATANALMERMQRPYLGGVPILKDLDNKSELQAIHETEIGYIQHIDMNRLDKFAKDSEIEIYINALPGVFITPDRPLAYLPKKTDTNLTDEEYDEIKDTIRECFIVDKDRSYKQDPRFGLSVLSEIAQRAMSPAINDPGTAIQILGTGVRVLSEWANRADHERTCEEHESGIFYPNVHAPGLKTHDLLQDFFAPIVREAAGNYEVSMRLQKSCVALSRMGAEMEEICAEISRASLEENKRKLVLQTQLDALEETAKSIGK